MSNKIIALFVEGPTEIEFYTALVKYVHDKMESPFACSFKWLDMHGIGNYKDKAVRQLRMLKNANPDVEIIAVLCIDTDAFEFSPKPPFDKKAVKEALQNQGADKVYFIEAKQSIEDWFLLDYEGVLSYLKLPKNTKKPGGSGQDALKKLFKAKNRMYIKGKKTEGFIKALDIAKIAAPQCKAIKPLCNAMGANCSKVCGKK